MYKCETCYGGHDGSYGSGRFCSSFCARKFSTINKRNEINDRISQTIKDKIEQGLIIHERKKVIITKCPMCKNEFESWECRPRIYCSKKCYLLDSNHKYRKTASGGYRKGSGRSKSGYYKGIFCHSTYELAYLIYCLEHDIKIKRCHDYFEYEFKGERHKYYPDFIVDNCYIETKGYHTPQVDAKIKAVNKPIKLLYKKDLLYCFEYIKDKYGKPPLRIYELYDNHKPKYTYVCDSCNVDFNRDKKNKSKNKFCSRPCAGKYRVAIKRNLYNSKNVPME